MLGACGYPNQPTLRRQGYIWQLIIVRWGTYKGPGIALGRDALSWRGALRRSEGSWRHNRDSRATLCAVRSRASGAGSPDYGVRSCGKRRKVGHDLGTIGSKNIASPIKSADEPVSRILSAAQRAFDSQLNSNRCAQRGAAIIPLGPGSLRDSSSLPEGRRSHFFKCNHTGRAGPPLLFGLAPRGVFRAPGIADGAVGSYPTFSPLPNALCRNWQAPRFPASLPPRPKPHRRFIFCGTFRSRVPGASLRPQNLKDRPPGVTRRVAPSWPALASSPRPESGLSSRPGTHAGTGDHPAHPLTAIIPRMPDFLRAR